MRVPVDLTVRSPVGRTLAGVSVFVYERGTTTEADVYDAESAGSLVAQPLTTNAEGQVADRWVEAGSYDLNVAADAIEATRAWEAIRGVDTAHLVLDNAANTITAPSATDRPLTIRGAPTQENDLFRVELSDGAERFRVGFGGIDDSGFEDRVSCIFTGPNDGAGMALKTDDGMHQISIQAGFHDLVPGAGPHITLDAGKGEPLTTYFYTEVLHMRDGKHKVAENYEGWDADHEHFAIAIVQDDPDVGGLEYTFLLTTEISSGRTIFNTDPTDVPATYYSAVDVRGSEAAVPVFTVTGAASQSAPLLEARDSARGLLLAVQPDGSITVGDEVAEATYIASDGVASFPANATDLAFQTSLFSDNNLRWEVLANGSMKWGSGAAAVDTVLSRSGTKTLQLADNAGAAAKLNVTGELELDGALNHDGTTVGFYGTAPATKQTVSGSRGGNAALTSLLTALATLGLITNSSSA